MKTKIRKGDTVEVISGRQEDKGRRGEVIRVLPDESRVVVQGINMRKKTQRRTQTQTRSLPSGIIEFEAPISISNVMLVCPKCKERTKVRIQRDESEAQRVCKKCQSIVD